MEEYTEGEVATHNTVNSCWIISKGKVYDVTSWLIYHPGGSESILKKAGTDCSFDFDFHSKNGHKYWKQYQIGKLKNYKSCVIS